MSSVGKIQQLVLADAEATVALGRRLGAAFAGQGVVYLLGDLGAGKTTLTRGILQAYGHAGPVKSPTYTLVEPYELDAVTVFHFDLYRLLDPEELELMGYREYFREDALTLVEWPVQGEPLLPPPDWTIALDVPDQGAGRVATISSLSASAADIMSRCFA
ncbi:MAG: tRNA (adenosine(37)-N6)-threonylcarbamoyltransferase complex ATPase subunit type 1 TsaE [Pseudomonadota bacterium]